MIRNYNSKLATALVNNLKKNNGEFNAKEITTAGYSNKDIITHALFDFPKKITPIILGSKEKIIFAVVWLSLLAVLFNASVKNVNQFTSSNKSSTSVSSKKSFSKGAADCKDAEVLEVFEELASKRLIKEVGHGVYINKVHSVEELGYNPKSKVRLCRARINVASVEKGNSYVSFLIDYATTKTRIELGERWLPI